MSAFENRLAKLFGLAVLYVFASPVLLAKKLLGLRKQTTLIERIRGGTFPCEWCGAQLPLNQIAKCPVCRGTSPGSLLRCSLCGATFSTITCTQCNSTVRVR